MITIYTSPSCSSCRKVKKYFEENKIPYKEKNILVQPLKDEELKDLLLKSENGTEDIISTRSKVIKEGNVNIDDMSINELIKFIKENPSVLKRPIMVDDHKMQVGYSEDEISAFIPRARRFLHESICKDCIDCDPSIITLSSSINNKKE